MPAKIVPINTGTVSDQAGIADMLESFAADIRAGRRPNLRRICVVSLDGVKISVKFRGDRGSRMDGVGMLEYAKIEVMMPDEDDE